jgi:hypothetical protein
VLGWAALGAFFVALQVWVYVGWVVSGDARPTHVGAQPPDTIVKVWAWLVQGATMAAFAAVIVYCVRQSRRQGRLSFDTLVVIAWASVVWQDPILNYIKPQFLYNSYLINLGSWVEHVPGWLSPRGANLPEPLFLSGFGYFYLGIGSGMIICTAMRRTKRRWPSLGVPALIGVALATAFVLDLLVEGFWVRTSLYAYSGAVESVSLWGGQRYQFPLYESLLWGSVWASVACLRYFRDDYGRSAVERGADQLAVSERRRTALRALALIGFANLVFVGYNVSINAIGLQNGATPAGYPTYLRNEMCGEGTPYACPDPTLPIVTRHTPVEDVPQVQR